MQNNIQEGFDYIQGQIYGLQAAFALLARSRDTDAQEFLEVLQGLADHTVAIDTQGDFQEIPRDRRGPFWKGVRKSIERITQSFQPKN